MMAKIETAEAVRDHVEILQEADGLMVARGDLGQAVRFAELPMVQDQLIAAARAAVKPVVVATQFLEIFAETGAPQRSELSDLALAARQRPDAIMLGKETVWSSRPIECIFLARDVLRTETRRMDEQSRSMPLSLLHPARRDFFWVAIEGPNGAGKTTLCHSLCRSFGFAYCRGVPPAFEEHGLKLRMIRDADWLASAFYFLSGAIEAGRELPVNASVVVSDRCVWSTLAVHFAHDPDRLVLLNQILKLSAEHVPVPDLTIVLEASSSTCRARIAGKTDPEKTFDDAAPAYSEFAERERQFYRWLQEQGANIRFICVDDCDGQQVLLQARSILEEAKNVDTANQ